MAVDPIHGIYLVLERQAKARGDRKAAGLYRQQIRARMAANRLRRQGKA